MGAITGKRGVTALYTTQFLKIFIKTLQQNELIDVEIMKNRIDSLV
jgi:hypothetical protein